VSEAGKKYADVRVSGLMKGVKPIKPILTPDYKPDFIAKEMGVAPSEKQPESKGETVTPAYLEEIKEWAKSKIVTKQDFVNTIFAVAKINLGFDELTTDQQIEVYRRLKTLMDNKNKGEMKPMSPEDFGF